ncbi:Dps family protein [Pseudonocardia nigra]|uniref:Dps family protein n=1 Tax=Pseudonocardia nigra TaxID=1921578 RepID=UPI001C5F8CB3|nr:DNA starvation/stationary phase protection protein [Pseudonocardia nigra]
MADPIPSTLDEQARDTTGAALQATLVDLVDLSLVAKQAHWNLVGRQFHDVHLHLDELVNLARTYTDEIAERAAAIGVPPDGRAPTVSSNSGIPSFQEGWVKDRDVIKQIFESVDIAARRVRTHIDETAETDLVTQDLMIELAGKLEEARWMWQAQNIGYETDKPAG